MGVHKLASNTKKTHLRARDKKAKKTYNRVKHHPKIISEIADIDIVPESTIAQRQKNSRTNVTISGKKKRKIMKQLKRLQKSKEAPKDVEMDEAPTTSPTKKGKKGKKGKKSKSGEATEEMDME